MQVKIRNRNLYAIQAIVYVVLHWSRIQFLYRVTRHAYLLYIHFVYLAALDKIHSRTHT